MSRIDGGLRSLFRDNLPQVHWQSVETGGTGLGVPDSNGCHVGVEWWIEYKLTGGWTVDLRPEQIGWLMRRHRAGGRVFVAVRRRHGGGPRRGDPADELYLLRGEFAREMKDGGLRQLPLGAVVVHTTGGPAAWDWSAVLAGLVDS